MEGAVTYLKMRDRKLTEKFLSLAVKDTFVPVLNEHFYQVKGFHLKSSLWTFPEMFP